MAVWLYGLNLTRLYTVLGRAGGYKGLLSVGRVQTPVLGLVVRRDLAIEAFTSKPFYTLNARITVSAGQFDARWAPGEGATGHQDEDGRVVDRAYVEERAAQLTGKSGVIESVKTQHKKEAPPLPFALQALQKVAAQGRGLSPKRTLEVAQSLYERHQVLTYPRSDCAYLPLDHWNEAAKVRDAIAQSIGTGHDLHPMTDSVDLIHRGKCWNDTKITAHHAIIPTKKWVPLDKLTSDERWVYEQVAHRYLLQFCVDREYDQTDVALRISGRDSEEQFKTRGRVETEAGWTSYRTVLSSTHVDPQPGAEDTQETTSWPTLAENDEIHCANCDLVEKKTTPPKRFTEATLLDAMTGISRYVQDPDIKQTLKDTDGLGTPATQATIMDRPKSGIPPKCDKNRCRARHPWPVELVNI
jgi:DNA topoisomerase-3